MHFNAWQLSRAWQSVALAQGDDDARPALYRTTLIEMYPEGIRLISTDGYILLKGWVPAADSLDDEPGADVLPDDVAIASDRDQRVISLMKYAQQLCRHDGVDTPITIRFGFGEMSGEQGTIAGLTQTSVWFHLGHDYDERIETPQFEGQFPNWRPLWFGHRHQQTGYISFGAGGILRLGKLSNLWGKAAIEFSLGGSIGVAKVHIKASDVFVDGLVMPVEGARVDPTNPVPPSIDHEYGDALDEFLAEVLRAETSGDDDDLLDEATRAQVIKAAYLLIGVGHGTPEILVDDLGVTVERAVQLLALLVEHGVLGEPEDAKGDPLKYPVIVDGLEETDLGAMADDLDLDDDDGEEPL